MAGVCAGIGEILDIDPTIVRLAVIFGALLTAIMPFIIVYIIGWVVIPEGAAHNEQVKDPA